MCFIKMCETIRICNIKKQREYMLTCILKVVLLHQLNQLDNLKLITQSIFYSHYHISGQNRVPSDSELRKLHAY